MKNEQTQAMKLYPTLEVDFTYQNFGSAWLGILRGPTEQIELAFNGLFNLCATNGKHEFQDHLEMTSLFWTSRRAMRRFFFNRFFLSRCTGWRGQSKLVRQAMRYAHQKLEALRHEPYLDFAHRAYMPDEHNCGKVTAERPDADMKDAILAHAFANKSAD